MSMLTTTKTECDINPSASYLSGAASGLCHALKKLQDFALLARVLFHLEAEKLASGDVKVSLTLECRSD
jgi:hypothetical protein